MLIRRRYFTSLALGTTTTIAIAWGSAVWVRAAAEPSRFSAISAAGAVWVVERKSTLTAERRYWQQWDKPRGGKETPVDVLELPYVVQWMRRSKDRFGKVAIPQGFPAFHETLIGYPPSIPWTALNDVWRAEDVRGFPLPALAAEMEMRAYSFVMPEGVSWNWGIGLPPSRAMLNAPGDMEFDHRVLPLRPLPIGMTIDTAAYAIVWHGALTCLGRGIRVVRSRRGLCSGCGYAFENLPICPECGKLPNPSP